MLTVKRRSLYLRECWFKSSHQDKNLKNRNHEIGERKLKQETVEYIRETIDKVSVAGITSLIYIKELESGKDFDYLTLRKFVLKETCRIKQKTKLK